MNETRITIRTSLLGGAYKTAAKNDVRYYLNGVLVEFNDDRNTVVGTDGHVMSVYTHGARPADTHVAEAGSVIIPGEAIETLLKGAASKWAEFTTLTTNDGVTWTAMMGGRKTGVAFQPVDGRYPDWRKVLPNPDNAVESSRYLVDPNLALLCMESVQIAQSGTASKKTVATKVSVTRFGTSGVHVYQMPLDKHMRGFALAMPIRTISDTGQFADTIRSVK